jgi:methylenetetrahydrofolate dehydrogenase (NADP+)/methenyltetrahydrofolate cyclohydrolase
VGFVFGFKRKNHTHRLTTPHSAVYVKRKQQFFKEHGMNLIVHRHCLADRESGLAELARWIDERNADVERCDGVFVQLPIVGRQFDNESVADMWSVLDRIERRLDVDGLSDAQQRDIGSARAHIMPAVVHAVDSLLCEYEIETSARNIVVLGRSRLVARPLHTLLGGARFAASRVERYDSLESSGALDAMRDADLCIAAIGAPHCIDAAHIKRDATLIDIGTSFIGNSTTLCGDFAANCYERCAHYTPVPGGIGPITVASLALNTLNAHRLRAGQPLLRL